MGFGTVLLVGFIFFSLFVFLIIFLSTRSQGRRRTKAVYLEVDEDTDALIQFPVHRKKNIQAFGTGFEIYPSGMFKKPQKIKKGYREIELANVRVVLGQGFQSRMDRAYLQEIEQWRQSYNRLANYYAYAKQMINQLQTKQDAELTKSIDRIGEIREKGLPKFIDPKKMGRS